MKVCTIRLADLEEVYPLRQRVLIDGTDRDSPAFEGDDAADTLHFGVFSEDLALCVASFMLNTWEGRPAWQLRGMATAPEFQGRGLGARLLRFAERSLARTGKADRLWCNARTSAVGFYLGQGWREASEEFLIDGVGPHRRLVRDLPRLAGTPPC